MTHKPFVKDGLYLLIHNVRLPDSSWTFSWWAHLSVDRRWMNGVGHGIWTLVWRIVDDKCITGIPQGKGSPNLAEKFLIDNSFLLDGFFLVEDVAFRLSPQK
jgi:hypothetical protein